MPVYSEEQLKEKLIKELDTEHCEVMHILGKMDAELRGFNNHHNADRLPR